MEYTIYELLFFLFCYSFIGWCGETLFVAVRRGHFHNRGVFGVPFSLSYGIMMDLPVSSAGSGIYGHYLCLRSAGRRVFEPYDQSRAVGAGRTFGLCW